MQIVLASLSNNKYIQIIKQIAGFVNQNLLFGKTIVPL